MPLRFTDEEKDHGILLNEVLTLPQTAGTAPSLPKAFQDARGKAPPPAEEGLVKYNLGAQLADQQVVDRRNTHRTFHQMGGQFGFRGNDKKK
jgi:hypothetical protein